MTSEEAFPGPPEVTLSGGPGGGEVNVVDSHFGAPESDFCDDNTRAV